MTRFAIVARSEALGASLARMLSAHAEVDVVSVTTSESDVPSAVDVVVIAREGREGDARRPTTDHLHDSPALTTREREVLALLADGLGNKQIAARLAISPNTVKTHLELLFDKLGVSSRAEAVAAGVRRGLLLL